MFPYHFLHAFFTFQRSKRIHADNNGANGNEDDEKCKKMNSLHFMSFALHFYHANPFFAGFSLVIKIYRKFIIN